MIRHVGDGVSSEVFAVLEKQSLKNRAAGMRPRKVSQDVEALLVLMHLRVVMCKVVSF